MKILVIGELCIDKFIYGSVTRMCPEAPVPVLNPTEEIENRGMAGNVVENLKVLKKDLEIIHWHQVNNLEKVRFVEKKSNHMIVRVDYGETTAIQTLGFLSPERKKTISESDFVIISDYNKGFLTHDDIINISSLNNYVFLDSKKILTEEIIRKIHLVKLNEIEYKNNKFIVDKNPDKFIITLGSKGVMYKNTVYPSKNPQETIDVSGAGDTFVSAFSLKYYLSKNILESIEFANDVCADVVGKKGVAVPDERFILRDF